jgi:hypothetical protein
MNGGIVVVTGVPAVRTAEHAAGRSASVSGGVGGVGVSGGR